MNKIVYGMLIGVFGFVGAVCAESVAIYQVTDMAGESEHQILGKDEYTNLVAQIKEETKVFPTIFAAAKKEWESNKEDNKIPFPAAKIKVRTVKKVGSDFTSKEAAMKKLEQIEERIADKIAQDTKEKASGRNKKKADPEEVAKETMKNTLISNAISDVNRRMAEKLGREVPVFGFMTSSTEKKAEKKEVKKEPEKKDAKKEPEKKDAEKKPAH